MILSLYRGLTQIAGPLISRYLNKRLEKGKEHPTRFHERLGQTDFARPDGELIWFHGASVGEAVSLLPLIDAIQHDYPDFTLLITTGTVTSAALMEKRLPSEIIHQFVPVDRPAYVKGFLDHWRPDYAIWSESDLWPNLIMEAKKRNLPMALVNARMSDKSLSNWKKVPGTIQTLLSGFDLCCAQTDADAERFRQLGIQNVQSLGNLKYASPELPYDVCEFKDLRHVIGEKPIWLAASTHPGDELLSARVHCELHKHFPKILTIIAPRHPERGDEITQEITAMGLNVVQRSKGETPDSQTDIYVADTLGEMGIFYRLSPIVFMGKSMEPLGGQNPLEPARLDNAIICGPFMTNFREIVEKFKDLNAISIVENEHQLADQIATFLNDDNALNLAATKAKEIAQSEAHVLERVYSTLKTWLDDTGEPK